MAEQIILPEVWHLEYEHAAGEAGSRFLVGLRDQQALLASPCPTCGKIRVPPRAYCEDCFVPTSDKWVEVGPEGVVESFTITYAAFPGYRDPPHAIAYVQPDGASTAICNYVEGVPLDDIDAARVALSIGQRMRAVFAAERQGRVTDFTWWPAS